MMINSSDNTIQFYQDSVRDKVNAVSVHGDKPRIL